MAQLLVRFWLAVLTLKPERTRATSVEDVASLAQSLLNYRLPQHHLNVIYDPKLDLNTWCSKLHATPSESQRFTTSLISGTDVQRNWTFHHHRFSAWSWVNFVLVDGAFSSTKFESFTQILRTRAVEQFFEDYTVLWQSSNFNRNLLQSASLAKLKFKVELKFNPEITFSSICFYCDNGSPLRLKISEEDIFTDYSANFHGKIIRLTGGIGIPLLMDFQLEGDLWHPRGGFLIDPIFFHMQSKMNFSLTTTVFNTFGSQLENGSFTGFVNELYHERAEIGMAGQSYDRMQAVHFLDPIHIDSVSYATAVPWSGVKWQAVFSAFKNATWLIVGCTCVFIVMPLYLFLCKMNLRNNFVLKLHIRKGFAFILRPTFEQDLTPDLIPRFDSGRVLVVFWLCSVLILSTLYRSKLTSLMVIPETENLPNSFEHLAKTDYKAILHHVGGALHKNIQSTSSVTFRQLSKKLHLEPSMYKCLLKARRTRRTACISYIHNIIGEICRNFTDANGIRSLKMAQAQVFMTAGSYMVPKSAIYKQSMNFIVANQIAFGFAKYALDKAFQKPLDEGKQWARERPDLFTWSNEDKGPRATKLGQVIAPLILHFICLILAFLYFCFEKFKNRKPKGKRAYLNEN